MEAIKQWIVCIIICSLVTAVILVLSPDGNADRPIKTVVAIFMICAFLSPFFNGVSVDADFDLPDFSENENELSDEIVKNMISEAEKQSEIAAKELFDSLSVEFKEIEVMADINENNEIFVKRVSVTLSEKFLFREKQLTSNLKSMFSSEVEFIWVKE